MGKVGVIDLQVKSAVYREILKNNEGRDNVVSIVNIVDLDDNKRYKLICGAYLERAFLRLGAALVDQKFRVSDGGIAPGKRYRIINIEPLPQGQAQNGEKW